MRVVVVLEQRFDRTPDGKVWTDAQGAYSFWRRYLEVFDEVRVAARVRDVPAVSENLKQADGARVTFAALPYFVGPWQFVTKRRAVRRAIRQAVAPGDAVILRASSTLANSLENLLLKRRRPYGVELVADPYDVLAPGSGVKSLLRPFLRAWYVRHLRQQCQSACAIAYVTARTLQKRYPASPTAFTTHYSSIELPERAFVAVPRGLTGGDRAAGTKGLTLVFVGSLAQLYKAPDVLIDAVGLCVQDGLPLRLNLIGDGQYRGQLEQRVARAGLAERVRFLGQLPGSEAVRAELDRADLFVLPSRTEGLPRAVIEAMARGLPCLGSTAGGIPELLEPQDMVPPGDATALAQKIRAVAADPRRLAAMAARNLEKAREYREEILHQRRLAFYRQVREATERYGKNV